MYIDINLIFIEKLILCIRHSKTEILLINSNQLTNNMNIIRC